MRRVAVLDLGTNTFRLLLCGIDQDGRLKRFLVDRRIVRIGEGFIEYGNLSESSLLRGRKALQEFARLCAQNGVKQVSAVATGVFREASNATDALRFLCSASHFPIRVITGTEEGRYTLRGIREGMDLFSSSEYLVVDIGGGSTELIRILPDGSTRVRSIPIGAVYLKDAYGDKGPLTSRAFGGMVQRVRSVLADSADLLEGNGALNAIGTGGSITTLSWLNLGLDQYRPEVIHDSVLTRGNIGRVLAMVSSSSVPELIGRFHIESGRADLIPFGGILAAEILRCLPEESIRVSDYGLLEGVALEVLRSPSPP